MDTVPMHWAPLLLQPWHCLTRSLQELQALGLNHRDSEFDQGEAGSLHLNVASIGQKGRTLFDI